MISQFEVQHRGAKYGLLNCHRAQNQGIVSVICTQMYDKADFSSLEVLIERYVQQIKADDPSLSHGDHLLVSQSLCTHFFYFPILAVIVYDRAKLKLESFPDTFLTQSYSEGARR